MKDKKMTWILIIAAAGVILAAVLIGVIVYGKKNQFDLEVGGYKISREEYLDCVASVQYDTKVQIQQEYGVKYDSDFWKQQYDGRYGYEILAENTLEQLKYVHAVYDVAVEYGDIADGSYEAVKDRWEAENKERKEKIAEGQVVYGLKEYTFSTYQKYEISIFKETYCNDDTREGMDLTEEEIVDYYNSQEWIFDENEENADLETAKVAVKRELRELKYDNKINDLKENSLVTGDFDKIAQFTLKNM